MFQIVVLVQNFLQEWIFHMEYHKAPTRVHYHSVFYNTRGHHEQALLICIYIVIITNIFSALITLQFLTSMNQNLLQVGHAKTVIGSKK